MIEKAPADETADLGILRKSAAAGDQDYLLAVDGNAAGRIIETAGIDRGDGAREYLDIGAGHELAMRSAGIRSGNGLGLALVSLYERIGYQCADNNGDDDVRIFFICARSNIENNKGEPGKLSFP